jgi:hypothetical protein
MKWIVLGIMMTSLTAQASCLPSADPCDDMIYLETGKTPTTGVSDETDKVAKEPAPDFHWSDEKDPEEKEWLKSNWD